MKEKDKRKDALVAGAAGFISGAIIGRYVLDEILEDVESPPEEKEIRFACPKCGTDIKQDFKHCPGCGVHLDWTDEPA